MRKTAAPKFCGDCGYKFARDLTGPCPMCARFEQLRIQVAAVGRRPTPSEYRAVLAAQVARRALVEGRNEHAATVISPALRRQAKGRVKAHLATEASPTLPSGPLVSPITKPTARRRDRRTSQVRENARGVPGAERQMSWEEITRPAAVDAHLVARARKQREHRAASEREYPWLIALWVIVFGALAVLSIQLASLLIR